MQTTILPIVNILLILYLFLLSLRIVLGWFAPQALGQAWRILTAATDPYLNLFRGLRFLRAGLFDFTPIAAILVLVVLLDLVSNLLSFGRITLGFFLASVLSAAWTGASFILLFFLIVGIVRAIPLLFPTTGRSAIWRAIDMVIQPVVAWVGRILRVGPRSSSAPALFITLGFVFVVWLAGRILIKGIGQDWQGLVSLLQMLPV